MRGPTAALVRWHLSIRARRCLIGAGEHSLAKVYSPNISLSAALCHHSCSTISTPHCSIRCRSVSASGSLPLCLFWVGCTSPSLVVMLDAPWLEQLNLVLERTRADVTAARYVTLHKSQGPKPPHQFSGPHPTIEGCRALAGRIRRPSFRQIRGKGTRSTR